MKNKIINYILALFSAITLITNWNSVYFNGWKAFVDYKIILILFLSFLLSVVYKKYSFEKTTLAKILAIIFSFCLLVGNCYLSYGTIAGLYQNNMILWSIIKMFGYYQMLYFIINSLIHYDYHSLMINIKDKNILVKRFSNHPLITCLCVLFTCWSIYYIAFYPIVLSPDPSYQIKQFLGERTKYLDYSVTLNDKVTITNHHPVFHTILIGGLTKFGMVIGNDNLGLFMYSLLQGVFMAFTLSQTICLLKKKGVGNKYLLLMLAIYALVPMFPLYALNGNKDVYYSLLMIWLLMLLFEYVDSPKMRKMSWQEWWKWFIILFFICLFRNNGIYIAIFLFPFILFYKKINIKKIATVFAAVICLFFSYQKFLLPALGITAGSVREKMSIFFQQTARYVINHEDELSSDDKKAISAIIDYDKIKSSYNPLISDPIKNTYNKYATSQDMKNYFKVWLKGLINHPMTYIDATLNNVFGYFDPEDINWYTYTKYDTRITNLVNYHYNNLEGLRTFLSYYAKIFPYLPIVGLISNIGFSFWIIFAMGIWLWKQKQKSYIIILIPSYVSWLVCIASPVNTYFRYAMPYVFIIPFVVGIWFYLNKKRISE
ncbi:MAG: hypothetical protein E7164_00230 [Firmicutes bacterium]|nr:hypothetical protein [Bacillota bacterium]